MLVLLIVAALNGYYPSLYTLQVFYYSFCMFVFVLALSYTTCSVVIFFRDLQSIVNIFLQVGMWATPVLWNINDFPMKLQMIVKINPLVYIVEGYRSAVYGKQWFWEDFYSTVYFWIITVVLCWHWCADFQETQDSFCGYHVKENWLWNKKNWQFMWTG